MSNAVVSPPADPSSSSGLEPSRAEFEERLRRTRARMSDQSLTALVVTDPSNLYYLSGFNAWSFYTPQCLVVTHEGDPVLFARTMDAAGADVSSWLPDSQVEGYPETYVHQVDVHPFDWIVRRIVERGLITPDSGDVVGFEGESAFFTIRSYLALEAGLPGVTLRESNELVNWVRIIKSETELDAMRAAGRTVQQAIEVAYEAMAPGRRECDIVSDMMASMISGTDEYGGDYPSMMPVLPDSSRGKAPHATWTDARLESGYAKIIEIAGACRRYNVPVSRTIMLGTPPQALLEASAVVKDGVAAAMESIRPGVTAHAVHQAWNDLITSRGFSKESRLGYSIGIGFPPDWGERTLSVRAGAMTPLEQNMCLHLVTAISHDGWAYMSSEPIIVTADGVERLTSLEPVLKVR